MAPPADGSTVTGAVTVEASLVDSLWDRILGVDFYVDGMLLESQGAGSYWASR